MSSFGKIEHFFCSPVFSPSSFGKKRRRLVIRLSPKAMCSKSAAFLLILSAMPLSFAQSDSANPQGWLLVANKGEHTLGLINPAEAQQVAVVPEGGITGHEVIASPDGKFAYVPIYGNSGVGKPGTDGRNIVVVDVASRKVTGNIEFDHGVRPHCPVFGPKDGMLYVTTELDKTISIIDPKTLKIVGTVPTGQPESHMLAISSDGRRGYTANVGPGTVSVLDMEARKTLKVIPISRETQRISISPDDSMVFTPTRPSRSSRSSIPPMTKSRPGFLFPGSAMAPPPPTMVVG